MAARDIMPWTSVMGGTYEARWGIMTAAEVFEIGEPVMVVAAGSLTEPIGATTSWSLAEFTATGTEGGIACFGPGAGNINPRTGVAFATGDDIAYWPINQGNVFITDNFFATGDTTTAVVPVQGDVGEDYIMNQAVANTAWGIEQTAGAEGTDVIASIIEVLDANYNPIRLTGQAGVYLLFTISLTEAAP
jgi:hypothetical protein